MNRRTAFFILIGLAVAAGALSLVLYLTRGSHLELKGSVQKFRTLAVEENNSIAIIDFRFINPSDYTFVVKKVTVTLTTADGQKLEGANIAELDARRVFEYYPALGQKFNETLRAKEKLGSRQTLDRMIAVSFSAPEAKLQSARQIRVRIDDVDGASSEIVR